MNKMTMLIDVTLKMVSLLLILCELLQVSGRIIRTQATSAPILDNDLIENRDKALVNGSLYLKVEKPENIPESVVPKKHNSFLGFSAWKESTQIFEDETIIFDNVTVNEGGHFQPADSRFTCPFQGIYYVAFTYRSAGTSDATILTVQNDDGDNEEDDIWSYSDNNDSPNNINSNSYVMRCGQGEQVYVLGAGTGAVYGELGVPHSTFTVFLMHQEADEKQHDSFIGFSSYRDDSVSYEPGDVIPFDQTWLNEGGHYYPEDGQFQCPVTGIYWITVNFMRFDTASLHLSVDKSSVAILHSDGSGSENRFNVLSNMCVVRCRQGETLSIKATDSGWIHDFSSQARSTFSVMLMHAEGSTSNRHSEFVGFTAWKTTEQSYTEGEIVPFEEIILNQGGHYDQVLGTFACDVSGIYFVALTCKKSGYNDLMLDIQVGSITAVRIEDTEIENPDNTMSNSALVKCFSGEFISVVGSGSGYIHGDPIKALSTFSAMLMFNIEDDLSSK